MFCLLNPNGPTKCCALFLVVGGTRCNNLSFTLEGISLHAPHHWTHKNFTEIEDLEPNPKMCSTDGHAQVSGNLPLPCAGQHINSTFKDPIPSAKEPRIGCLSTGLLNPSISQKPDVVKPGKKTSTQVSIFSVRKGSKHPPALRMALYSQQRRIWAHPNFSTGIYTVHEGKDFVLV